MNILYTSRFKKHYKKRIQTNQKLVKRFKERISTFIKVPNDQILDDHALKGAKASYRSFSITGDIRVVYRLNNGDAIFYDIGTHNQVY